MENQINVNKILNYIKENNLTKTEFCKRCKLSLDTFNALLNDSKETRLKAVYKIAREMNCSMPYLFED